jgi:outer membrane protein assembly factor BamA
MLTAFAIFLCFAKHASAEAPLIVQDIECHGNVLTACSFIRGALYLSPGSPVDEEEIRNAVLRLSALPNFVAVKIHLEKGDERGRVLVIVEVTEADPWTKESVFATSVRGAVAFERIAGRISNENLWGTNKVVSLEANGVIPLSGFSGQQYYARIQYADPRLFDNKNYFLIGGTTYQNDTIELSTSAFIKNIDQQFLSVDLRIGRRIFDFSYLLAGYIQYPVANRNNRIVYSDGTTSTNTYAPIGWLLASYGWNTEDDPFFPTRGSRLQISYGGDVHGDYHHTDGGYRQTWKIDHSLLTLILGNAPGIVYRGSLDRNFDLGLEYGRDIGASTSGEIRKGRWYVQIGQLAPGSSYSGDPVSEAGVKAGVRLDTKTIGIVDVYFFGTKLVNVGGGQ